MGKLPPPAQSLVAEVWRLPLGQTISCRSPNNLYTPRPTPRSQQQIPHLRTVTEMMMRKREREPFTKCYSSPLRSHRLSFLDPDALDFLIASQDGFSVRPREPRGDIGGVAPFELRPGDLLFVGPGDVRNVGVLDIDCVERFARRSVEKNLRKNLKGQVRFFAPLAGDLWKNPGEKKGTQHSWRCLHHF